MNTFQKGREQGEPDHLDQFDELIQYFRPIEKLFQLMGAVSLEASGEDTLVKGCSEIGVNLSAQFRDALERVFKGSSLT